MTEHSGITLSILGTLHFLVSIISTSRLERPVVEIVTISSFFTIFMPMAILIGLDALTDSPIWAFFALMRPAL